ncbi:unnamed protein product, partial [Vitis vinifera]|uniref:Uncharacterized protein n=1 Tax=Vitis vinifera TaxID=29760 RepID=D7U798_VITVI
MSYVTYFVSFTSILIFLILVDRYLIIGIRTKRLSFPFDSSLY